MAYMLFGGILMQEFTLSLLDWCIAMENLGPKGIWQCFGAMYTHLLLLQGPVKLPWSVTLRRLRWVEAAHST